ncbi:MAG TPA: hypothetical protein VHB21_26715 [Minicystis sp.]|nr:hypothetical protein [Minicystis sp.]
MHPDAASPAAPDPTRAGAIAGRVRLPLQTGASAFHALVIGAAVLAVVFGVPALLLSSGAPGGLGAASLVIVLGVPMVATLTLMIALAVARDRRASDALLHARGLRIEGGAHDGFHLDWADVDDGAHVEHDARSDGTSEGLDARFLLDVGHGVHVELARSGDEQEKASLDALAAAMQAWSSHETPEAERAPRAARGPTVVACPGCDAPVRPEDDDAVTCPYCGASVPMPQDLPAARAKV